MNAEQMKNLGIPPRRFQVGNTVKCENGIGTVVAIYTEVSKPHHRVDVRWARGSKSYREEDGLEKADKSELHVMEPKELAAALEKLGPMWGLDRPLQNSEMARALRLGGRDPGRSVQDWLTGSTNITGPVQVAISMMLAGSMPPDPMDTIVRKRG